MQVTFAGQGLQVVLLLLTGAEGVEITFLLCTNFNTFCNHLARGFTHRTFLAFVQTTTSILGQPFPGRVT